MDKKILLSMVKMVRREWKDIHHRRSVAEFELFKQISITSIQGMRMFISRLYCDHDDIISWATLNRIDNFVTRAIIRIERLRFKPGVYNNILDF